MTELQEILDLLSTIKEKAVDIKSYHDANDLTAIPMLKKYLDKDIEKLKILAPSDFQSTRLTDLLRHFHFSEPHDYNDIITRDIPSLEFDFKKHFHGTLQAKYPVEITESLENFRNDHPSGSSQAFVIMRFSNTAIHNLILKSIRDSLQQLGLIALRADDKEYHSDLFYNVLTYIYGCGLAVAVFEHLETEQFNPNVSLEVGYMLALGKPVCLLKDKTLKALPTDLIGKLYRPFDPSLCQKSIHNELTRWLSDKDLLRSPQPPERRSRTR